MCRLEVACSYISVSQGFYSRWGHIGAGGSYAAEGLFFLQLKAV